MRLKVGLLGGGSWGTTVAAVVSRNAPISLWARDAAQLEAMREQRVNQRYLPGIALPPSLELRHWPGAQQQGGVGLVRRQPACQQQGLVEAAPAQPRRRQWHGQHPVAGVQCGLHPGRAAHQHGKCAGPAGFAVELEARDAARPRVAVGHRGQARVQRRRRAPARPALPQARGDWQRTGGAARNGLRKACHAGLAQWLRRPGVADLTAARHGQRSPCKQCTEHRLNILGAHLRSTHGRRPPSHH